MCVATGGLGVPLIAAFALCTAFQAAPACAARSTSSVVHRTGRNLHAATADDVAQIALKLGFEFSGDELLRVSGQRFDRVTVRKNDIPGEYT